MGILATVMVRWNLEFVSDAFTDGRRLRIFVVDDEFTRENLALIADIFLSDVRVLRALEPVANSVTFQR